MNLLMIIGLIVVAAAASYTSGCSIGTSQEHARGETRLNSYIAANERAARQQDRENADKLQAAEAKGKEIKDDYEIQVAAEATAGDGVRAELSAARRKLRDTEAFGHPLSPESSAPPACGDYEADRTKLSERDQSILIDLGVRADEAVIELTACQRYVRFIYDDYGRASAYEADYPVADVEEGG